jgi:hypothetical protein
MPQGDHRRDDGSGGKEPPDERGQLVQHAGMQPGPITHAAGEEQDRQQRHHDVRLYLLRRPAHGREEQQGVDRQHHHPGPDPARQSPQRGAGRRGRQDRQRSGGRVTDGP